MFKSLALNNFNLPSHSEEFSHPPIQLNLHSVLHRTAGCLSKAPAAFEAFWNAEQAQAQRAHWWTLMGKLVRKVIFIYFLDR